MLHELTPEQAAKLARLWQWQKNQSGWWGRGDFPPADPIRMRYLGLVLGGLRCEVVDEHSRLWRPSPRELMPDLDDAVTRDGLLRTCRKAWMDDAFAMRSQSGKWKVYVRSGLEEHVFEGATEDAALLAAILAAPEAK